MKNHSETDEHDNSVATGKSLFIEFVKGAVKCAMITVSRKEYGEWKAVNYTAELPIGYRPDEYDAFLERIDVTEAGWGGGHQFHGTVWMMDGSWYDVYYDRSWGCHTFNNCLMPDIPRELKDTYKQVEMYNAIEDVSDNIFSLIQSYIVKAEHILKDAGYPEGKIKEFLINEMYSIINS